MATMLAVVLKHHHAGFDQAGDSKQAITQIAQLVLSVGIALLAGYLLRKKNKALLKDDKPTTLVTRGSFMNWVLGVRRVGPLFAWAGDRFTRKEKSGKKGLFGSSPKTKVFYEGAWHLLAVGPGFCLHQILDNGKAIFKGPITRDTNPSGTFVDLGSEGGFFIYWGEPTQPINTRLGDSTRVGLSSRWPYHFYIDWVEKRLGQSPNWSLLDYEIEVRIETTILTTHNVPHLLPTRTLTGPTETIDSVTTAGGTDLFTFEDQQLTGDWRSKQVVRLTGNACADQDLEILFTKFVQFQTGVHPVTGGPIFRTDTEVHFLDGSLAGCDAAGTLQLYESALDFGINGAHALAEMLHAPWPRGLNYPQSGIEQAFDINDGEFSLEELAILLDENNENLRTSWIGLDGDSFEQVIGPGLQDLGVMVPISNKSGLVEFRPIREPSGTLPRLRNDILVDELPEIEVLHIETTPDRLTFSFPDRQLTDRDATITIMDDGQIERHELQHAKNVQITITTDFNTASAIAQRRSQEEMGQATVVKIKANRAARTLVPGMAVTVDALPEIMRMEGVGLNAETNEVRLTMIADSYGVPKSPFIDVPPPTTGQPQVVAPDLAKAIVEVPEFALGTDPKTVLVPRIRANSSIFQADIHLSADNSTYIFQGTEFALQTGGLLDEALPALNKGGADNSTGGLVLTEIGPEFQALGPDIGIVEDLSLDETNWKGGRQWAVIVSLAGTEICFLRNVTAIGGTTWRLDGLIRGRYGDAILDHPVGAEVFIFTIDEIFSTQDILLQNQVLRFAKTQPVAGGVLPLDADTPVSTFLYGKDLTCRPAVAAALHVTAPTLTNSYEAGDDVDFQWGYPTPQSPSAGAGLQGAGVAVSFPAPDGDFVLEIRDATGVTVVRTESVATNVFTYTNVNIVADLGGGQPTFQVWVYQRRGGLLSDPVKLIVERI